MSLDQILLFALLGLGTGALIAGIALGVVLFYRGSGVINLATGAIAMLAGYSFWSLRTGTFGADVPTAPALVITLVVVVVLGVLMELLAFRPLQAASPLAKLAASLGVLLTLQAAMLISFGTASKPQPPVLPSDLVEVLGVSVPIDRFILAGIVVGAAGLLAALFRWSRFGLATRAASEDEVSAMLTGLSPSRLSMANTLLACLVAGGLGVLAASITQLNSQTLPLQIVPALAAALLARFTSFGIACAAGLAIGMAENVLYYLQTQSWFPTDHGSALPGVQQLFVFVVIVIAMFWRGASLPGRGELIEKRLPAVPRPERLARTAAIGTAVVRGRTDRAPVGLPAGARRLAAGRLDLPVAGRDHGLRRPDLGRPARARRRRRLHRLAHGGRPRHRVPARAAAGRGRGDVARAGHRRLGLARARGQPGGRDAGRRGRDRAVRLRQLDLGRRLRGLAGPLAAGVRLQLRLRLVVPRARRQAAEPGLRVLHAGVPGAAVPARRQCAPVELRAADARGALERAGCGRGGYQRHSRQAGCLRAWQPSSPGSQACCTATTSAP